MARASTPPLTPAGSLGRRIDRGGVAYKFHAQAKRPASSPFQRTLRRGNLVKHAGWLGALLVLWLPCSPVLAGSWRADRKLHRVATQLHGTLVDHTHNHGADHRMWSEALHEPRDMYVYLPPGFDPARQYPLMFWLHGFAQDEQSFRDDVVGPLDEA